MRHYLDHAATTPMRESATRAWLDAAELDGNASSLHAAGRATRALLEDSRERVAGALGAHPTEVIFTSGATEANNLAIKGLFWSRRSTESARTGIVTSSVEHHAALDPARWLTDEQGARLVETPVDGSGRIDLEALGNELLAGETLALASVQWVNNEVGTIQPLAQVVALAADAAVPVHSDAAQAVAHLPVDFASSGLTTMAVSAHKVGGPVGVGALVARRHAGLVTVIHGGGQERGVRSGTLNVPGAAAFAAALEDAVAQRAEEAGRLRALRARLIDGVLATVPEAVLSGPDSQTVGAPDSQTVPGIVHFVFPGASGEALLLGLDERGIDASNGSACTAGVIQSSHVLIAMGWSPKDASSTLRFSMGHTTTREDIEAVIAVLPDVVAAARRAGALR